jgi:hypothetical protein
MSDSFTIISLIYLKKAKNPRERQDIDSSVAQSIVIGTMDHMITLWLLKNMSYSLFEKAEETFDLLESAFSSKERS